MSNVLFEVIADDMIKKMGFEDEMTIEFISLVEEYEKEKNRKTLEEICSTINEFWMM